MKEHKSIMPMIKGTFPEISASEICSVQPMIGEVEESFEKMFIMFEDLPQEQQDYYNNMFDIQKYMKSKGCDTSLYSNAHYTLSDQDITDLIERIEKDETEFERIHKKKSRSGFGEYLKIMKVADKVEVVYDIGVMSGWAGITSTVNGEQKSYVMVRA